MKPFSLLLLLFTLLTGSKTLGQQEKNRFSAAHRLLEKTLIRYRLVEHNPEWVKKAYRENKADMKLSLPFPEGEKVLTFEARDIHASGFQVLDSRNKEVTGLEYPRHYALKNGSRGKELGSLTLFSNGDFAFFYSDKKGNVNLSRLPDSVSDGRKLYASWYDHHARKKPSFLCGLDDDKPATGPRGLKKPVLPTPGIQETTNDTSCRLTEIYWECDHDMYQKGGSIQGALNQFEAMFNGTAILFEVENVNIGVKAVKVWNTPDPYTYTSSFTALGDFQEAGNQANWPGQLAHLLSTRPLSLGGVAFLDAICSNFRYAFSNIDFLVSPLPAYSWTISTIAHELGHNFASPHTHNCNWEVSPGVFGQIDSCWNAEGDCQEDIVGRVGTIMSYCHLTGSVNLSLGFGPLPGNRIREAFETMSCVSGTIVIPNFTPVNSGEFCTGDTIRLEAENLEGFSYRWTGPNGYSSDSRIALVPDAQIQQEGKYGLRVKKAACESREKKTDVVFNCMKIGSLPASICAGATLSIPFSSTGFFNPGNTFRVELSNGAGNFSNPRILDTIQSAVPGTFGVSLPTNLNYGLNYRIRLVSSNPSYVGKPQTRGLTIQPVGVTPTPVSGERCGPGPVDLSAQGGSNLLWFDRMGPVPPIAQGRNFRTPVLNETRSFFVQGGSSSRSRSGLSANQASGPESQEPGGFSFTVLNTLRLDSISLLHQNISPGTPIGILKVERANQLLYRLPLFGSGTVTRPALYWRLDPADGYVIRLDSLTIPLKTGASGWGSYPILLPTTLQIKGNLSGDNAYPYLFDWNISRFSACPSARVEVQARIRPGTVPETAQVSQQGDSLISSQTGVVYQWLVNGQVQNFNFPKIRGLQNSSYQIRYKIDSCWSEWSAPVVFTIQTSTTKLQSGQLRFFPNPGSGALQVEGLTGQTQFDLLDARGRSIEKRTAVMPGHLDFRRVSPGLYWLRWQNEGNQGGVFLEIGKEF